jgi:hypothetical protein
MGLHQENHSGPIIALANRMKAEVVGPYKFSPAPSWLPRKLLPADVIQSRVRSG